MSGQKAAKRCQRIKKRIQQIGTIRSIRSKNPLTAIRFEWGKERIMEKILDRHIEITPGIVGGKPRIAGHRITVQNIVIWHERQGISADEIATKYDLSLGDVYAALAYHSDHRKQIEESIRADEAFVAELRKGTPSKIAEKLGERATQVLHE